MIYVVVFLCMYVWTLSIYVCMNLIVMCCWFNHHFGLLVSLPSSLWCIFARVFPSSCVFPQVSRGCTHSPFRVLEPFMHLLWLTTLVTPLLPTSTSYLPLCATAVKATPYKPLLGLLYQTVWGLFRTSYWGDPLTFWWVQHCEYFDARRRARWQVESSKYVLHLCIFIMTNYKVSLLESMSYGNDFEISEDL